MNSRIVWEKLKVGTDIVVISCRYGPEDDSRNSLQERFWEEVDEYEESCRNERMFLLADMHGKVGDAVDLCRVGE